MLYGDSFVYMSILLDRGYGKIYNGKVNVLLHNYTTRAAQTFDCAAQVLSATQNAKSGKPRDKPK